MSCSTFLAMNYPRIAAAELLETHGDRLFLYCWSMLRSRETAQTALRDTLLAAAAGATGSRLYSLARAACGQHRAVPAADADEAPVCLGHNDADNRLVAWNAAMSLEPAEFEALELGTRHDDPPAPRPRARARVRLRGLHRSPSPQRLRRAGLLPAPGPGPVPPGPRRAARLPHRPGRRAAAGPGRPSAGRARAASAVGYPAALPRPARPGAPAGRPGAPPSRPRLRAPPDLHPGSRASRPRSRASRPGSPSRPAGRDAVRPSPPDQPGNRRRRRGRLGRGHNLGLRPGRVVAPARHGPRGHARGGGHVDRDGAADVRPGHREPGQGLVG